MEYKIDVLNKFAAFQVEEDIDEDPYEALLKLKEQIIGKKVESSKTTNNKKGPLTTVTKNDKNAKNQSVQPNLVKANASKPQNLPVNNNVSKIQPNRPPRMGGLNSTEKDTKEKAEQKETFNDGFRERNNRGEMIGNRGAFRARGRGGRLNDTTDRVTGKREFERHSGSDKSGFKPIEKKEGGGSHNWGSIKDDIDDQIRQNDDDTINKEAGEIVEGQKQEGEEGEKTGDEEAVEERQMTLDEWKQQEEQKRVRNNFKIRKPGEGCRNDPKWNEMYVLKKKAEEEEEEDEDEEYEEDDDATRKKNVVPIRITFNDQQKRGGRGRGGMRGGQRRGGASENGPSRLPTSAPAPNVDDENDFPSLA